MKGSDQNLEPRAGAPGHTDNEGRERVRVLKVGDQSRRANKSQPPEWAGGSRRAAAPDAASAQSVFVIAKRGAAFLDTPVFHAGESGEEAVALFTGRQQAQHYLDRAGWGGTDEVGELSPGDLLRWLTEANGEGVRYAAVNPDRDGHLGGQPQAVLALDGVAAKSSDGVFQEVTELARG